MIEPTNPENWETWLDTLATTDSPQVCGQLAGFVDGGRLGYCCLGLGSHIAGIQYDPADGLAPVEFIEWLGLPVPEHAAPGFDLLIDWGPDLETPDACPHSYEEDPTLISAATLNDGGFTFKQIADILRHFGVSEAQA